MTKVKTENAFWTMQNNENLSSNPQQSTKKQIRKQAETASFMLSWTDFEHVLTFEIHHLCTMTAAVPQCAIGFMHFNIDFFSQIFQCCWGLGNQWWLESSALTQVSHRTALFSFGSGRHYSSNHEHARQVTKWNMAKNINTAINLITSDSIYTWFEGNQHSTLAVTFFCLFKN